MGPEDSNPALKLSQQALLPTGPSPQFHELLLFLKNGASTPGCWKKITGLNRASGTSPMWVLLDLKVGSNGPLLVILLLGLITHIYVTVLHCMYKVFYDN